MERLQGELAKIEPELLEPGPRLSAPHKKIYQIKQRDPRKPFSFICADLSDVANYAQVSNFAFKVMRRHLPGPYTFVLEATRVVPDLLTTRQKTVGIRIPDNPIALAIVRELGHPLVTTSANVSGHEPAPTCEGVRAALGDGVAVYLCDEGEARPLPSTVVELLGDEPRILREGAIPADRILAELA